MQDNIPDRPNPPIERPTPVWTPAPSRPARLSRGARAVVVASLAIALIALALSLALALTLWRVGRTTATALDGAITQLDEVCGPNAQPVTFTFSQTIRFKGDIAMPEGIVMPFKGTFPVNTVVRLTVPGLPGAPEIEVPINTAIPIDTQVPIPGGISIPVDTEVPVNQDIPVELCGQATGGLLRGMLSDLRLLRQQLPYGQTQ